MMEYIDSLSQEQMAALLGFAEIIDNNLPDLTEEEQT
jgi:hypothetical protein